MTVTFFGHRDAPETCKESLYQLCKYLIEEEKATRFLIGTQGNFDRYAQRCLSELRKLFPHIQTELVLAYRPEKEAVTTLDFPTVYPSDLIHVPLRFAIYKRNEWLIKESDTVVTYVTHLTGGAALFKDLAKKKKKRVYNLPDWAKKVRNEP